eukprot:UN04115
MKNKPMCRLQYIGTDGDNASGCVPLLKFVRGVGLQSVNKVIIADCCRTPFEVKGPEDEKTKLKSTMTIFTAQAGKSAIAGHNSPSKFSYLLRHNVSKFYSDFGG